MEEKFAIQKYFKGDIIIWGIIFFLALFSLLVIYSTTGALAYRAAGGDTEYYLLRHGFLLLVAIGAAWLCHNVNYIYYSRISRLALVISVPLLLYTWLFGATYNEASRWITIPLLGFNFQPSDLAKLALITNLASMLSKRQKSIKASQKAIQQVLIWCGVIGLLIGLSDLSSAGLLMITCMMILFIGRVPVKYLGMLVVIGVIAGALAFALGQRGTTGQNRWQTWYAGWQAEENLSFQLEQSYIAIASGGSVGKGVGQSTQKLFVPHPYSDFVFSIVVEEYGLLGGAVIIGLYLLLLYRGLLLVYESQRTFGGLLASGLSIGIALQAFSHIGVVLGLVPTTGLTLPFVSMGGTSLVFTGIALGIILSVSKKEQEAPKAKEFNGKNRFKSVAQTNER